MSASPVYSPERGVGSNQFRMHTVTRKWDDADLLTGRVIWTPSNPGDLCFANLSYMKFYEAWNGTTPRLLVGNQSDPQNDYIGANVTLLAAYLTNGVLVQEMKVLDPLIWQSVGLEPFVVVVDDGAGGPVGGTTGSLELNLITADPRNFVVPE